MTFPMNELALVTGVKGLSDDDPAKHMKSIGEHCKAIGRHSRGLREHLKALFDGFDDDTADDVALIENDEGDDEDSTKAFVQELRRLAVEASALS